jgi:hypothetical protein
MAPDWLPSRTLPRGIAASVVAGALVFAPSALGDSYYGADPPIGQMSIRLNPKTHNATIEARYIRATCTDGAEPGGRNPGSIKTRISRKGRFHATISSSGSFFYLAGRVDGRRAHGTAFFWYTWFGSDTCTTGPISWSIPRE